MKKYEFPIFASRQNEEENSKVLFFVFRVIVKLITDIFGRNLRLIQNFYENIKLIENGRPGRLIHQIWEKSGLIFKRDFSGGFFLFYCISKYLSKSHTYSSATPKTFWYVRSFEDQLSLLLLSLNRLQPTSGKISAIIMIMITEVTRK